LQKESAKHLSYYHPERDGSKSDTLAVRYPAVETSNLPLAQRNWTCPFRKITLKTVAQARYKQYKANPREKSL